MTAGTRPLLWLPCFRNERVPSTRTVVGAGTRQMTTTVSAVDSVPDLDLDHDHDPEAVIVATIVIKIIATVILTVETAAVVAVGAIIPRVLRETVAAITVVVATVGAISEKASSHARLLACLRSSTCPDTATTLLTGGGRTYVSSAAGPGTTRVSVGTRSLLKWLRMERRSR